MIFLDPAHTEPDNNNDYIQINDDEYDKRDVIFGTAHTEPVTNHNYIQMDEEEDDESDVFLGPAQPKPVPQISIISQVHFGRTLLQAPNL